MSDKSLIQFILDLLRDPKALAEFKDNPDAALRACGLTNVSPANVHDAIVLAQDNDDVSFDRDYNTGGGNHSAVGGASVPPPPPESRPGESDHDAGVRYLDKYVSNNYVTNNIDDRDTIVDNSVNQNIDTGGGDLEQNFDNNSVVASGDGAVAAGGDIEDSTVTTGNGNVVGDGNAVVNGDENTIAFGSGSAASFDDVKVDNGGALSVGGDATGNQETTDSFNDTRTETNVHNSVDDSFNTDTTTSVETNQDDHSSTDLLSHNSVDVDLPVG